MGVLGVINAIGVGAGSVFKCNGTGAVCAKGIHADNLREMTIGEASTAVGLLRGSALIEKGKLAIASTPAQAFGR